MKYGRLLLLMVYVYALTTIQQLQDSADNSHHFVLHLADSLHVQTGFWFNIWSSNIKPETVFLLPVLFFRFFQSEKFISS